MTRENTAGQIFKVECNLTCCSAVAGREDYIFVCFPVKLDAQEVLQRKHHSVKNIDLFVKPLQVETVQELCQVEDSQGSLPSTIVVLDNVQKTVKDCVLIMLVENISGLSEDDGDFSVEMIPEISAAVVTFTADIGKKESELQIFFISYLCVCVRERLSRK